MPSSTSIVAVLVICSFLRILCSRMNSHKIPEKIKYELFTPNNQQNGIKLTIENLSNLPNLPTKFLVHGWTTSPNTSPWYPQLKDAYFSKLNCNVIYVDWSTLGNRTYVESSNNAVDAGYLFGDFIVAIIRHGVSHKDIHLIGHSLGAHMVGFAGKRVQNKTGSKIDRVTGLDPARPLYEVPVVVDTTRRLSDDDAEFVDIVHTDSGKFGLDKPYGHVDFYPNGGRRIAPGCDQGANAEDENCSHARSTQYYIESVNSSDFKARKSTSWEDYKNGQYLDDTVVIFGENVDRNARGKFYFRTSENPPFARGD